MHGAAWRGHVILVDKLQEWLRGPQGTLPIFPHSHLQSTSNALEILDYNTTST